MHPYHYNNFQRRFVQLFQNLFILSRHRQLTRSCARFSQAIMSHDRRSPNEELTPRLVFMCNTCGVTSGEV
ncbi:MAG: hypothetical protein ACOX5P_03170 [Bacilli bacterium]